MKLNRYDIYMQVPGTQLNNFYCSWRIQWTDSFDDSVEILIMFMAGNTFINII